MENICYNCGEEKDDGDWRYNEEEGNAWFCRDCLDNGSVDEENWN